MQFDDTQQDWHTKTVMIQEQQYYNPPASNGSDFQPPTSNPQTVPGQQLQQQDSTLQGITSSQEALGSQGSALISVPSENASEPVAQSITTAQPDYLLLSLIIIGVLLVGIFLYAVKKSRNKSVVVPESNDTTALGDPVPKFEKTESEPPKKKQKATPKKKAKKSRKNAVNKQKRGKKK